MRRQIKQILPVLLGLLVLAIVVYFVPQAVRYQGRASGTAANIEVNYEGILGKLNTPWRNLAQGGEESKDMLDGVINDVKLLKPEYIRLDHIYDAFNVVSRGPNGLVYDWSGLDSAVATIQKTGAKPFLSLSYMPSAISKSDIIDVPNNWSEWAEVVKATIERYSGKNQKNIDYVIYEVWNEPDLFGGFKTYGDKNYLTMYEVAARAADNVRGANLFEIGGPATTAPYQNWVERLIKYADQKSLRLDFVSWHRYSTDLSQFESDIAQVRSWTEGIPAFVNMKYYVTEWGHDSEIDPGYDSKFGAIHTIAGNRIMLAGVDRAFMFEIKDGPGPEKLWGRWGMLTHEKWGAVEKKPRFYAVEFLNRLGETRLGVTGEGSWVKAIGSLSGEDIKLLLVNYDASAKRNENVPVKFENLPSGSFRYIKEDFMGAKKEQAIATTSATWSTMVMMPPNSASIITLKF